MNIAIAIDAMGGDFGPPVALSAALTVLKDQSNVKITLVGDETRLHQELKKLDPNGVEERLQIQHASQVVDVNENVAQALRGKKDSSMRVAINLVRDKTADACVSAGNTGALMATARFVLKTLPGIDRPAIVSTMPSMRGHVHVLDLGANVDSPSELLLQFGVMGSVLVKYLEDIPEPSVALLNIGVEDIKGNETIKRAAQLMRESNLNYQGYIEGDAIYTGDVDVIVCDGLVGNVALKTSEGLAQMVSHIMKTEFQRNIFTRVAGMLAKPVLSIMNQRVDHRRYNGATLLGLRGTVIKSHGSADTLAFVHAIKEAIAEVKNKVPEHIEYELQPMLMKKTA